MDMITDRHMGIKTLSRKRSGQNLSYAHYLSGLHNTIQHLYDISPPTKVLPPCFCCPYACLLAQRIAFLGDKDCMILLIHGTSQANIDNAWMFLYKSGMILIT